MKFAKEKADKTKKTAGWGQSMLYLENNDRTRKYCINKNFVKKIFSIFILLKKKFILIIEMLCPWVSDNFYMKK